MQGQADQNPPLLTWKKLTVQAFKQGTKTHGCLHTAGKIKKRSAPSSSPGPSRGSLPTACP